MFNMSPLPDFSSLSRSPHSPLLMLTHPKFLHACECLTLVAANEREAKCNAFCSVSLKHTRPSFLRSGFCSIPLARIRFYSAVRHNFPSRTVQCLIQLSAAVDFLLARALPCVPYPFLFHCIIVPFFNLARANVVIPTLVLASVADSVIANCRSFSRTHFALTNALLGSLSLCPYSNFSSYHSPLLHSPLSSLSHCPHGHLSLCPLTMMNDD